METQKLTGERCFALLAVMDRFGRVALNPLKKKVIVGKGGALSARVKNTL